MALKMYLSKLRNRNGRQRIYAIYGFMKINGAERTHMVYYKKLWWLFRETDSVIFIFCWIPRNFLSFDKKLRREEEEFAACITHSWIYILNVLLGLGVCMSTLTLYPRWIYSRLNHYITSGAIFRIMSKLLVWWYPE